MNTKFCPYCLEEKEAAEDFEFNLLTFTDGTQQCNYCEYVFGHDDDVEYDETLQIYINEKTTRDGAGGSSS